MKTATNTRPFYFLVILLLGGNILCAQSAMADRRWDDKTTNYFESHYQSLRLNETQTLWGISLGKFISPSFSLSGNFFKTLTEKEIHYGLGVIEIHHYGGLNLRYHFMPDKTFNMSLNGLAGWAVGNIQITNNNLCTCNYNLITAGINFRLKLFKSLALGWDINYLKVVSQSQGSSGAMLLQWEF